MGTLALELGGSYTAGVAIWAGLVGAVAMLAVIYGSRAAQLWWRCDCVGQDGMSSTS